MGQRDEPLPAGARARRASRSQMPIARRSSPGTAASRSLPRSRRVSCGSVYLWTIGVVVLGTLVTAAGPHGGDEQAKRLTIPDHRPRARARQRGRSARDPHARDDRGVGAHPRTARRDQRRVPHARGNGRPGHPRLRAVLDRVCRRCSWASTCSARSWCSARCSTSSCSTRAPDTTPLESAPDFRAPRDRFLADRVSAGARSGRVDRARTSRCGSPTWSGSGAASRRTEPRSEVEPAPDLGAVRRAEMAQRGRDHASGSRARARREHLDATSSAGVVSTGRNGHFISSCGAGRGNPTPACTARTSSLTASRRSVSPASRTRARPSRSRLPLDQREATTRSRRRADVGIALNASAARSHARRRVAQLFRRVLGCGVRGQRLTPSGAIVGGNTTEREQM